jgi:DNA modification methylase
MVLDPFSGAGTVKLVAKTLGRHFIGAELNPEYIAIGEKRTWVLDNQAILFETKAEQLSLLDLLTS